MLVLILTLYFLYKLLVMAQSVRASATARCRAKRHRFEICTGSYLLPSTLLDHSLFSLMLSISCSPQRSNRSNQWGDLPPFDLQKRVRSYRQFKGQLYIYVESVTVHLEF